MRLVDAGISGGLKLISTGSPLYALEKKRLEQRGRGPKSSLLCATALRLRKKQRDPTRAGLHEPASLLAVSRTSRCHGHSMVIIIRFGPNWC